MKKGKRIGAFFLAMCMSFILVTSASANAPDDLEAAESLTTAAASGDADSVLQYGEREVVTVSNGVTVHVRQVR